MEYCNGMSKIFETVYIYLSFKNTILLPKETDTNMLKTVDIQKIRFKKIKNSCWKNISSLCLRQLVTSLNNCPAREEN